ncbi:MAG: hypothetical protein JNL19_09600 [Burkholderiales bacterium]|nr:hypothetical protein [Burkholderiales bacterium]
MLKTSSRSASTANTAVGSPTAATEAVAIAAQSPLRARLGLFSALKVDRAIRAQTVEAVRDIESAALAASTEITLTAIEHRRAEQLAALAAAGVIRYGAIAQELLLRTGVVQAQLTDVQFEAFVRQVEQRGRHIEATKAAHSRGLLTDDELEAALDQVARLIAHDSQRTQDAATHVKDVVSDLAEAAAGHIARGAERAR